MCKDKIFILIDSFFHKLFDGFMTKAGDSCTKMALLRTKGGFWVKDEKVSLNYRHTEKLSNVK
jgi:hypothetical protein